MAFQVTAPLVVVRTGDGGPFVHVYEGGLLPSDADPDHVAQLVDQEMVVEVDDPPDNDDEGSSPSRARKAAKKSA